MNKNHEKYKDFLSTKNNWPLDDWSINCECFEKIVELIEFDKTILELGSGKSTELLSRFYNIISVEDDIKYLNKYDLYEEVYFYKTGAEGFEPANGGTKNRSLTTWRRPIHLALDIIIYFFLFFVKLFLIQTT